MGAFSLMAHHDYGEVPPTRCACRAINAGGLVNVSLELRGYEVAVARERTMKIYDTIVEIAQRARAAMAPTARIADTMAQERLSQAR